MKRIFNILFALVLFFLLPGSTPTAMAQPLVLSPAYPPSEVPMVDESSSLNVEFVGNWPFGEPYAVAGDSVRNIAFCGSGGGVYIVDTSEPTSPERLSEIRTCGFVEGLFYQPDTQFLYIAAGRAGLELWDIEDPANPAKIGCHDTPYAKTVAASGSYAYVLDSSPGKYPLNAGLRIIDVSQPSLPEEIGFYDTHAPFTRALAVSGSYAYVASLLGLSVIDISQPSLPQEVGFCDSYSFSGPCAIAVSGLYAYVSNPNGLRVIDISQPSLPQEVAFFTTIRGHELDVAVSGSYAYVADWNCGLRIFDISQPAQPEEVGLCDTPSGLHRVAVSGSYAYVADWNNGLRIIDVSQPAQPEMVGLCPTPGGLHRVAVSGSHAYVTHYDGLRVIDISEPSQPQEAGFCDIQGWATAVAVSDSYAYVTHYDGLRVIDVSQPSLPQEVGFHDTHGNAKAVALSDSCAYVACEDGLRIIDVSQPSQPQDLGYYEIPGCWDIAVSGSYAYVTDDYGLRIIDVSQPSQPQQVGFCEIEGLVLHELFGCDDIALSGSYAYIPSFAGLRIIDVSQPSQPQEVGLYEILCDAVAALGTYAYVTAAPWFELTVIDVSQPSQPEMVGYYYVPGRGEDITTSDGYVYVATGGAGLQIYKNLLFSNNPPNTPSQPSPADGATGISIDADLSWTGGDPDAGDTVTYDVYFGTSSPSPLTDTIGPYPGTQTAITYDPGTLNYNTKYYWYLVATDSHSASTTGSLWAFTTSPPGDNDNPDVATGLATIEDELVIAYCYKAGEGIGGWTVFNPEWATPHPEWNTLTTLYKNRGYWIEVNALCNLTYETQSYKLDEGWNLIGWLGS